MPASRLAFSCAGVSGAALAIGERRRHGAGQDGGTHNSLHGHEASPNKSEVVPRLDTMVIRARRSGCYTVAITPSRSAPGLPVTARRRACRDSQEQPGKSDPLSISNVLESSAIGGDPRRGDLGLAGTGWGG